MHELGLCEGIVEAAVRHARGRQVSAVRVRVSGHPVDDEVVRQGFLMAATGSVVAGAQLELVQEPGLVRCGECGARQLTADPVDLVACARCGGVDVVVEDEDRAVLESIVLAASHNHVREGAAGLEQPT